MTAANALVEAIALIAEMTWDTWWALVLGFTLSGAVEVFVSEERMTDLLGGDGPREIALGAAFGAASSSCSYSAVGTAKSLFKKGASAVASLGAFMFAATDLVIELGLVMWVLLGWQFVVGEYVGGVIAVLVLAWLFERVVPQRWFDAAREHLHAVEETTCAACGMVADPTDEGTVTLETTGGTEYFCCGGCRRVYRSQHDLDGERVTWREKLLTPVGWDTAAKKTMSDWEMLWKDIALGFVLAGVIGAFVPEAWWTALFGVETGFTAVLYNTVLAVLIGIATFMCSVGNVPFALVLWRNGLPFGSVLAFIYADLIIPPLVRAYRRYYGTRMAAVLFGSLFVAAVVAGVAIHYFMGGLGLVPPQGTLRSTLSGEYTTVLNLVFTPVFLAQVYVAYGPDRIASAIRNAPEHGRRTLASVDRRSRPVRRSLWAFALELGRAILSVLEALWLVVGALVALVGALSTVLGALVDLLGGLWDAWRDREGD